ncbi:ribosomal protein S18-alanine N-acetyltransferase [Balneatrix alpica]|uniref:[Ribosomal protein bS18]-alanine N-acetyltransferase n=1 Tax=Balneatrix alpica TaxID=75684 RepID=A0ABV5ZFD5_9GAMM|nr:ribosomal protein S18-alanine N-acetyltransferase [Balneatrix alpica]
MLIALTASHLPTLMTGMAATFYHPWSEGQWRDSLQHHHCLGWQVQGQLAAHAVFSQVLDEAELLTLSSYPAFQRQGLARQLLQTAIPWLQQRGVTRLLLEVRASNQPALALYQQLGFSEDGRRKGYYPPQPPLQQQEDAVLLSRMI